MVVAEVVLALVRALLLFLAASFGFVLLPIPLGLVVILLAIAMHILVRVARSILHRAKRLLRLP